MRDLWEQVFEALRAGICVGGPCAAFRLQPPADRAAILS
jgi:hypothetical protein